MTVLFSVNLDRPSVGGGWRGVPAHSQALQAQAYAGGEQQRNPAVEGNAGGVAAGPMVLVVDDHADMRAYVAQCLEADFRVLTAAEGEAGLAHITDTLPNLVVSDLMMPVLDGLELCRRLKTDERTRHIPVVLLTARTADGSRLAVVEREMANADFDVEQFATALHLSRIQLYRKLKVFTDQAPTDFVRTLRLRRAAQLLAGQVGNVADVAYQVGFANLSYFSKCFRAQFGHVPSEHTATA